MTKLILSIFVTLLVFTACGTSEENAIDQDETTVNQLPEGIIDLANETCPVMGDPVMEGQFIDWEGYRIHFCCAGCDQDFLEDPEQYLLILSHDPSVTIDFSEVVDSETMASCHTSNSEECSACSEDQMCDDCSAMTENPPAACH